MNNPISNEIVINSIYQVRNQKVMGLVALHKYLAENPVKSIALPALGCGNGGLDWGTVKRLINGHLGDLNLEIRGYEPD